jgi:diadenosine tetraphosphate (Ap4A) HIT family hydrolase
VRHPLLFRRMADTTINATLEKFGYPGTLVRDYRHWCVLVRPAQATLGALVLGAKGEARSFAALPAEAFAELATVTRHIETGLAAFRAFDRINYLMLMMVDPHVHFHVLPRYQAAREWKGTIFPDSGWPGPPVLANAVGPDAELLKELVDAIASRWSKD